MKEDLDPEERSQQEQADEAFLRASGGYSFRGTKLEPYSALRQAAALSMGLMFGSVPASQIRMVTVKDEATGKQAKVPTYANMFHDVVYVLWLCHQLEERCDEALTDPRSARIEAFKWATDEKITPANSGFSEAAEVFAAMMSDITASSTEPVLDADRKGKGKRAGKG